MCANMPPGSRCPLDGELLCRNVRPTAAGQQAAACTAVPLSAPQAQPVAWEPARGASNVAPVREPRH